jgi:mannosyltransferase OCH1-like enzyme
MIKHPGWKLIIWNNKKVEETFLKESSPYFLFNEKAYLDTKIWAQKSDLLRYEILFWFGGIYLDVDIFCIKNIESVIENEKAFVSWSYQPIYCIENAMIGSIPHTKTMWNAIMGAGSGIKTYKENVLCATGPNMLMGVWRNDAQIKKLDHDYFLNHLSHNDILNGLVNIKDHPEFYSIHFCLSSWHNKERYDYQLARINNFIREHSN